MPDDIGDDYYDAKAYGPYTREHWAPLTKALNWLLLNPDFTANEDAAAAVLAWLVASGKLPYAIEFHSVQRDPIIVPWAGEAPEVLELRRQIDEMLCKGERLPIVGGEGPIEADYFVPMVHCATLWELVEPLFPSVGTAQKTTGKSQRPQDPLPTPYRRAIIAVMRKRLGDKLTTSKTQDKIDAIPLKIWLEEYKKYSVTRIAKPARSTVDTAIEEYCLHPELFPDDKSDVEV